MCYSVISILSVKVKTTLYMFYIDELVVKLQGDAATRVHRFGEKFVEYSTGWLTDTVATLLPSWLSGTSCVTFTISKSKPMYTSCRPTL